MPLESRPDLDEVAQRWDAFWSGRPLDRPMILAAIRKPGAPPAEKPYPVRPELDIEPVIDQVLAWADGHHFVGDTVPFFMVEFAAEHFATFLGASLRFHGGTNWVVPFVKEWDDVEVRFHRDSFYWQQTVEFIRRMRARCDGRVITSSPVLSAGLDALSAIRGPERLLMDLVDQPENILRALAGVRRVYHEVVEALAKEVGWDCFGTTNWLGMYHRGYTNTLQSDVSCMLSPGMFREFEVASLEHQASHYDAVAYHLDGPGAVQHLEAVARISGIEVIRYVPVPRETPDQIEAVYRRIDALGKGIVRWADPETARRAWWESSTRRLVLGMSFESRRAAEEFIASF
ncbi:MAG: hypothetical protein NTW87_21505 [Planctomycetota bacterium]|nr:hypothetical protein [Planctomycetota bacterium]